MLNEFIGLKEIWVFAESRDHEVAPVNFEMLNEARKLAKDLDGKTCVCLIGYKPGGNVHSFRKYGAEKVYLLELDSFYESSLDIYASICQNLIEKYNPLIMMFGATSLGSELAPRIAARLTLPCITEVKRIKMHGDNLVIAKAVYDDKIYENFVIHPKRTLVLTVLPGDFDIEESNVSHEMEVVIEDIDLKQGGIRTKKIGFIKGDPNKINLEEADLIVAGGKGIGRNLSVLEDLADILSASIGGTRQLVDEGIIPFERQIGITGKSVSPKFLMACGISGAREFVAGIKKARFTVAVNTDLNAPIFRSVDLAVHGDVNEIIPALVKSLRNRKK